MEPILLKGPKISQREFQYFLVDWVELFLCDLLRTEDNILFGVIFTDYKLCIPLEKDHIMGC